jgi:transcriptional regulator with XRE-family HTH domain
MRNWRIYSRHVQCPALALVRAQPLAEGETMGRKKTKAELDLAAKIAVAREQIEAMIEGATTPLERYRLGVRRKRKTLAEPMTLRQLGEQLGLQTGTVYAYCRGIERGGHHPSVERMQLIEEGTGGEVRRSDWPNQEARPGRKTGPMLKRWNWRSKKEADPASSAA